MHMYIVAFCRGCLKVVFAEELKTAGHCSAETWCIHITESSESNFKIVTWKSRGPFDPGWLAVAMEIGSFFFSGLECKHFKRYLGRDLEIENMNKCCLAGAWDEHLEVNLSFCGICAYCGIAPSSRWKVGFKIINNIFRKSSTLVNSYCMKNYVGLQVDFCTYFMVSFLLTAVNNRLFWVNMYKFEFSWFLLSIYWIFFCWPNILKKLALRIMLTVPFISWLT